MHSKHCPTSWRSYLTQKCRPIKRMRIGMLTCWIYITYDDIHYTHTLKGLFDSNMSADEENADRYVDTLSIGHIEWHTLNSCVEWAVWLIDIGRLKKCGSVCRLANHTPHMMTYTEHIRWKAVWHEHVGRKTVCWSVCWHAEYTLYMMTYTKYIRWSGCLTRKCRPRKIMRIGMLTR